MILILIQILSLNIHQNYINDMFISLLFYILVKLGLIRPNKIFINL